MLSGCQYCSYVEPDCCIGSHDGEHGLVHVRLRTAGSRRHGEPCTVCQQMQP